MFDITLKNNKKFTCSSSNSIYDAAKNVGIHLEHSCLTARCRSCIARVVEGETKNIQQEYVLSDEERAQGFILTCNAKPITNIKIDIQDLEELILYPKRIMPSKIDRVDILTKDVIKITLRLPPNQKIKYNAGQYVNLIKKGIKRSYSLANFNNSRLEFFIKNFQDGEMSNYWFNEAKPNDLIHIEGPLGTFYLRISEKDSLIFLATGTGVAPIKSILDDLDKNPERIKNKNLWVFVGLKYKEDLFWVPDYANLKVNFVKVLSREKDDFVGFKGHVQDAVLEQKIPLKNAQVYACGSTVMIKASRLKLINNGLEENQFFSDAFVETN